jgi:signal transduction histidine kinase
MKALFSWLTGTPLRWQVAALLIVTQIAAHVATFEFMNRILDLSGSGRGALAAESVAPFTTVLQIASRLESGGAAAIHAALAGDKRFRFSPQLPSGVLDDSGFGKEYGDALRASVPDSWRDRVTAIRVPDDGLFSMPGRSLGAAVQLPDGTWLVFEQNENTAWRLVPTLVIGLGITILALPLTLLAIWSGSVLVSPITALAIGADRFSRDLDAPDIEPRGAHEVRVAASAVNLMRARIRKLVEDRAQTLAAIGHDMRTPLTRLRLRAEAIADPEIRDAVTDEISGIERMINSALSFLRSQRSGISLVKVDLAVLAQTVVDDLSDQGKPARYEGFPKLVVECDHDLIRRVLENLTNNAITYAGAVTVSVRAPVKDWVLLDVLDEGPGIPAADREALLEPFQKGDKARTDLTNDGGGFGLGLAIAKDIVEQHGGTLSLNDNVPRGLVVSIRLPLRMNAADGSGERFAHDKTRADKFTSGVAKTERPTL